jgi:hypothetical protein
VTAARTLCEVADLLSARPSLRPGPEVDGLFGRLVRTIVETPASRADQVLADPRVRERLPRLRELAARGEGELERHWSARVAAAADPAAELARFPYLDNYRRLVRMEVGVLAAALPGPLRSVAVIGSGPLPLTSMLLAEQGVAVDGFDRDERAVAAARRLVAATGTEGVRFHHVDGADADLSGRQVVLLAALVGATSQRKAEVIARMRASMDADAILLARSARGLRALLYPPLDATALAGLDVLNEVHPDNDIINSVVVARIARDN